MLVRMAWRGARSRPAEAAALVVLVALSVLSATVSAGLLQAVAGASDRLLDQAHAPDVVQMHAGALNGARVQAWAADRDDVVAAQIVQLLTLDGDRLSFAGAPQTGNTQQNSLMTPSPERDLLLTLDGAALTEVAPGTVWLPVYYAIEDGLGVGETVTVTGADGFRTELVVAGFHRDAIMNTAIASSKRLAVSDSDFAGIAAHAGSSEWLIEFWLHDRSGASAFTAAYLDAGLPAAGPTVDRTTFRLLSIIGEGINAGVVILAAVLLLGVGLLCLRLSLLTALRREVRELGVLKAIGVPSREVRNIQLAKYGAIGTAACLLGLSGGLALLPAMSQTFTMYAGTSGDASAWLTPVATAVAMLGLILGFVLVLLRRLDRISAVRALRGLTERSRWRGPRLTLHRSRRMPTEIRMGLIGALRRCQTHGLLAGVFAVASFVVIVPLSASMTLASPSFITYMGVPLSDLRIDVPAGESGGAVASVLESSPDVDRYVAHTAVRTEISDVSGLPVSVFLLNGDHTTLPLVYADGRAPTASHEIALSLVALARTGHVVGDTIGLRTGDTAHEATIVGAYQDITNGGSTGRALLAEDGTSAVQYSFAVGLVDGTDPAQVAERLTAALPGARVVAVDSYRSQTLGPVIDRIDATARVAAAAAVALAVLVTVMIVRLILAADRGQIAIQRALGAPDAAIRTQYAAAVLSTLLVGVSLGILASATAGQSLFNVLFEGLYGGLELVGRGTSRIVFVADPRITLLAVPLTLGVTVAVATLAACRDISAMGIREVVTE